MKWASSSAVREKCLRVIHDPDDPAHSVSKSFAQLLSLLWLSLTHIVTHSIDCVWWFTSQISQVALHSDAHHCWLVCLCYWAYLSQIHQCIHHNVKFLHHWWSTCHTDKIQQNPGLARTSEDHCLLSARLSSTTLCLPHCWHTVFSWILDLHHLQIVTSDQCYFLSMTWSRHTMSY